MRGILLFHLCLCLGISLCRGTSNCVRGGDEKIDKWKVSSIVVSPFLMEGSEKTASPATPAASPTESVKSDNSSGASNSTESVPSESTDSTINSNSTDQASTQSSGQPSGESSGKYSGYIVDLLDKLSESLGTPYEITLVPDNRYGKKEGDKWNGLIGQVCDNKAHIAAAPITVTVDREEAIDFTYSILDINAVAVIQQPSEPINSLQSLLNSSYQLGIWKDSPILKLMAQSKAELVKKAYANIQKRLEESNEEGFKRLRKESNYAFIVEDTVSNYVIKKPPCGLQAVETNLYKRKYAFAVAQGSQLRDQINKVIVFWQMDGTLEELQTKWWGKNECSGGDSVLRVSTFFSLSLAAVAVLFSRFL